MRVAVTFYAETRRRAAAASTAPTSWAAGSTARETFLAGNRPPLNPHPGADGGGARGAAGRSTTRPCGGSEFNVFVVPPAAAGGPIDVYQISPQTAARPLSDRRPFQDQRRRRRQRRRLARLHQCLPRHRRRRAAPPGGGRAPIAVTHLLGDPLPTEIHVFLSIWTGRPLVVDRRRSAAPVRGDSGRIAEVRASSQLRRHDSRPSLQGDATFARSIKRFVEKRLARIACRPNGERGDISGSRAAVSCRAAWEDLFHDKHSSGAGFGASARRRRAAHRAARPRRRSGRRPPRASRPGASTFPRAIRRSSRATISGATPTTRWFQANPIPADRTVLGRRHRAQRGCRGAAARHRRDRQSRHRSGQPPGRGHVCELYGRGRDRGARHRAAAALSRPDRRRAHPRRSDPAVRDAGLSVADRRRHHSRSGQPDPLHRLRRPGRARHAEPRLLSARGRAI